MLRRSLRKWRGRLRRGVSGAFSWGDFRSMRPVDAHSGARRGTPVDRYYVERFLERQRDDIRGDVLETGFDEYTRFFGGRDVRSSTVLHAVAGNRRATVVGTLENPALLQPRTLDCILLVQTLQYVFDVPAALASCHRALRDGGVLLVTAPTLSKLSVPDMEQTGEFWRFTSGAIRRLLSDAFGPEQVRVEAHGNLVAATAFLHGLSAEDLGGNDLAADDIEYEMIVTGRAVRR